MQSMAAISTGLAIALSASWRMALMMFAMVPLLSIAEFLQWAATKSGDDQIRKSLSDSVNNLNEVVVGIREVQSFSLEKTVEERINKLIEVAVGVAAYKAAIGKGISMAMIQVINFTVYGLAFYYGGYLIDIDLMTFEEMNKALWAMAFAASGLGAAATFAGDAAKAATAVSNVFSVIDRVPPIDSKPWNDDGSPREMGIESDTGTIIATESFKGNIELEKVMFSYPTRKQMKVFNGISLSIKAGQTVAFVGSSGCGKSTIIQLLERFYDPVAYKEEVATDGGTDNIEVVVDQSAGKLSEEFGKVSIDGVDIRMLDVHWLRDNVGLVGQEPVLFDASIHDNIAASDPNASRDEVVAAAKSANAHEFIEKMPDGYDSGVGGMGKKLSGGQKQRIAIARAILKNPKILLLDEATSALDNESEKIVQASLDNLLSQKDAKRTTIVIAHRLSTIRNADCIFVLNNNGDGGEVVEQGTHEELLALNGKYKALLRAYSQDVPAAD
jgi:ATP-binding cassette subfamily B (MDR/TAP) protein 1